MECTNNLEYKLKKYEKDKYDDYKKYKKEMSKIDFLFEKENLLYKLDDFNRNVDNFLKKFKK